ncbi:cytochrome b5-like heme/steroid binding domain-containing protein [Methylococcus sp. EFPC2]|uniref:cytochrome b5 domain-containing protein n=1 Tax=Methylococcus sp. EFPC2 TaxID=2812648 RepID=UPI001967E3A4|nr:cytochrome b5-like heme/steroid binding domain-containing protein [Methylococcus sp. EFPC2]QSA97471.1 cytochrome b5 domain-containing protein [Methylococcus sp. EFPC2]
MLRLYLSATVVFWLLVSAFWAGSLWQLPSQEGTAVSADKAISPTELVKHALPGNCWMAIRGSVYDLTAYLPEHPSLPDMIEPWCGKVATEAYETKTKGRQHSSYADELLAKYRIGSLAQTKP